MVEGSPSLQENVLSEIFGMVYSEKLHLGRLNNSAVCGWIVGVHNSASTDAESSLLDYIFVLNAFPGAKI